MKRKYNRFLVTNFPPSCQNETGVCLNKTMVYDSEIDQGGLVFLFQSAPEEMFRCVVIGWRAKFGPFLFVHKPQTTPGASSLNTSDLMRSLNLTEASEE